jgi:hypothetical protein
MLICVASRAMGKGTSTARENSEEKGEGTKSQEALRNVAGLSRHRDVSDACFTVCGEGSRCGVGHEWLTVDNVIVQCDLGQPIMSLSVLLL